LSGYFSYDIIRYIENIPNKCKDDLKIPDARLLRPRTLIIHDNVKKKIFYIINCFADEKIYNYESKYKLIKKEIENLIFLANYQSIFTNTKKESKIQIKSNISKKKFLLNVNKAKKYIKIGDVFQVVLSQRFETKLTKRPIEIYKKLRIKNPSPFMYFFNFDDFQIIGASPEILVRLRDKKITIRPIAGTRPRGKNKKEDLFYQKDLIKDKKELAEHLMLLDLGRNDAGKVSKINTVKVTEEFKIEKYSHVMHIVSNVVGDFNNKFSKLDTLLSGFPAGTVSGAPKIRAMEIIDELENTKRKVYAGGIGYFSANGDFDTCIALRTAVSKNKKFYVQAGAGIVADSNPENEYKETVNKAKALLKSIE
jgi:anthranilate synthase component 1